MDDRQLAQLQAGRRSLQVLRKHRSVWEGLPGFVRQHKVAGDLVTEIGALLQQQEEDRKGIARSKEEVRQEVLDQFVVVAGQVNVWAYERGKREIEQITDVTVSRLRELGPKLPEHAKTLHRLASEAIGQGAEEFGLTRESLETLENRIRVLEDRNDAPRTAIAEGKTLTKLIAEKISQLNEQLAKRIDVLMRQFRKEHPGFYSDYRNVRRIGSAGRRSGTEEGTEVVTSSDPAAVPPEADDLEVAAEIEAIREEARQEEGYRNGSTSNGNGSHAPSPRDNALLA